MKKTAITATLAAVLLASTAAEALAQEAGRAGARREHAQGSAEQPDPPETRRFGKGGAGVAPRPQEPPRAATPPPAPQAPGADRWRRDDRNHGWNEDPRWRDRDWDRRRDDRYRDDRYRDRPRYDRRLYPPIYQPPYRYRIAPYRPPTGWYSFGWGFGDTLPHGWYGPNYLIMDWWAYGLPMPPIGYDWVRVGDDAVLIDTFTGRIVQVAHNLFW